MKFRATPLQLGMIVLLFIVLMVLCTIKVTLTPFVSFKETGASSELTPVSTASSVKEVKPKKHKKNIERR